MCNCAGLATGGDGKGGTSGGILQHIYLFRIIFWRRIKGQMGPKQLEVQLVELEEQLEELVELEKPEGNFSIFYTQNDKSLCFHKTGSKIIVRDGLVVSEPHRPQAQCLQVAWYILEHSALFVTWRALAFTLDSITRLKFKAPSFTNVYKIKRYTIWWLFVLRRVKEVWYDHQREVHKSSWEHKRLPPKFPHESLQQPISTTSISN
jgi:hypothetical protein